MRRAALATLLSLAIGFPSAVGITEVCANKDQAWAKELQRIAHWNATHQEYVKAHRLDRPMPKQTARLRARIEKETAYLCADIKGWTEGRSIFVPNPHPLMQEDEVGENPYYVGEMLDMLPAYATAMIELQEYPSYENPNSSLPNELYPQSPGFGGYGYVPVGNRPGGPSTGPEGPPSGPPTIPIAPAPELSTFSLVAFGLAMLITQRKVKR